MLLAALSIVSNAIGCRLVLSNQYCAALFDRIAHVLRGNREVLRALVYTSTHCGKNYASIEEDFHANPENENGLWTCFQHLTIWPLTCSRSPNGRVCLLEQRRWNAFFSHTADSCVDCRNHRGVSRLHVLRSAGTQTCASPGTVSAHYLNRGLPAAHH